MLICILHELCSISQIAPPMLLTLVPNSSCTVMTWSTISWAFRFLANPPLPVAQKVHLIGQPTCHAQSHSQTKQNVPTHVVPRRSKHLRTADSYSFGCTGRLRQLLLQSTAALNICLCLQTNLILPINPVGCKPAIQQHMHMHRCTDAQMHRCTDAGEQLS